MKTRVQITIIAIVAIIATSCSSTKNLSNTPSWSNEIYGTGSTKATTEPNSNNSATTYDLDKLEKAYAYIAETDLSEIENDTVLYQAESSNPYEDLLSNSYTESYERRLRGISDPYYGMINYNVYYSDAYWLAQAYDPAFYNIVIMGNQVWVEPRYISASFGWPRHNFAFGWGWNSWNFGWNYPFYNYYSSWPLYYSYWNNPWNNPYIYNNDNHHNHHTPHYGGAVYGRNPVNPTNSAISSRSNGASTIASNSNSTVSTSRAQEVAANAPRTRLIDASSSNNVATANSRINTTPDVQNPPTTATTPRKRTESSSRLGISEPTRGGANTYNTSRSRNQQGNNSNVNSRNTTGNSRPNATTGTTTSRGSYNTPGKVYNPSTSSSRNSGNSSSSRGKSSYSPSRNSNSSSRGSSTVSRSSSSSSRSSSSSSRSSSSSSSRSSSSRSNTSRR